MTESHSSKLKGVAPGFRYVEQFEGDEEMYEEEEVSYVTLDMGQIDPNVLATCSSYRVAVGAVILVDLRISDTMQGLDTDTPFIQLGDTVFMGHPTNLIGSEVLLEEIRGACLLSSTLTPLIK
jgi:general transcription factor 3C polypeptide 6